MKTAAQINLPQTGDVSISPTFPPVVNRRSQPASERLAPAPDGELAKSWSLRQLRDTRENVIEQINAAQFVPDEAKAFLTAAIRQSHSTAKLISVDAHCQVVKLKDGRAKHHGCWDVSEI